MRAPWAADTRLFELDTVEMLDFRQTVADRIGADARTQIIPVVGELKEDWPTALATPASAPTSPRRG